MHPTADNLSVTISEDFRKQEFSYTAGESAKRGSHFAVSKKIADAHNLQSSVSASWHVYIYYRKLSHKHEELCARLFIIACAFFKKKRKLYVCP